MSFFILKLFIAIVVAELVRVWLVVVFVAELVRVWLVVVFVAELVRVWLVYFLEKSAGHTHHGVNISVYHI